MIPFSWSAGNMLIIIIIIINMWIDKHWWQCLDIGQQRNTHIVDITSMLFSHAFINNDIAPLVSWHIWCTFWELGGRCGLMMVRTVILNSNMLILKVICNALPDAYKKPIIERKLLKLMIVELIPFSWSVGSMLITTIFINMWNN